MSKLYVLGYPPNEIKHGDANDDNSGLVFINGSIKCCADEAAARWQNADFNVEDDYVVYELVPVKKLSTQAIKIEDWTKSKKK